MHVSYRGVLLVQRQNVLIHLHYLNSKSIKVDLPFLPTKNVEESWSACEDETMVSSSADWLLPSGIRFTESAEMVIGTSTHMLYVTGYWTRRNSKCSMKTANMVNNKKKQLQIKIKKKHSLVGQIVHLRI